MCYSDRCDFFSQLFTPSKHSPRKEKGWLEGDKSTTHDIAVKLQTSLKPYEQGNKHIKQKMYAFERPCAIPSKVQLNM